MSNHIKIAGLTFAASLITSVSILQACGSRSSEAPNDQAKNRRAGRTITSLGSSFSDTKPTISSDGARIAFISTRDGKSWAYLFEDAANATAQKLKSTSDLNSIMDSIDDALILPSGSSVLFRGAKSGKSNLYLQDFAGQSGVVSLTTDGELKSQFSASADGKFVAFARRQSKSDGGTVNQVYLADLVTPQVVRISSEDTAEDTPYILPSASSPYTLFTIAQQANGKQSIFARNFTTAASATTASKTSRMTDQALASGIIGSLGTSKVIVGQTYSLGEKKTADNQLVRSRPATLPVSTGNLTVLDTPGMEILRTNGSASDFTFWVIRNFFVNNGNLFGNSLILRKESDGSLVYIQPLTSAQAGKWELAVDSTTKKRADGTDGDLDLRINDARFSANSTLSSYKLVYETTYSTDPEIRLLKLQGGQATFVEVSNCTQANNCGK